MKHRGTLVTVRSITIAMTAALSVSVSSGHNRPVHEEIAVAAGLSSPGLEAYLVGAFGPQSGPEPFLRSPRLPLTAAVTLPSGDVFLMEMGPPPSAGFGPIEWIKLGSAYEDRSTGLGNIRGADHFYDPLTTGALNDPNEGGQLAKPRENSFGWATMSGLLEPKFLWSPQEQNMMKWANARAYQYSAITAASPADRDANLALTLYALGHIIHLNQDLSEPEHVRNDSHPLRHRIESYGENNYVVQARRSDAELRRLFPLQKHGWDWWRANGFQRLEDFWNRGKYRGQPASLDADARSVPGAKLGLAEFSNGNFLGEDAT